ncbi:S26 family signal peptidase [Candidatus Enterococcus ferrettii]|uniref:Signal peptidase I n=1 Tax=Candidatus Enterococcus ferrettii TaxID=2815324 RepID=A0ABV0ENR6_9ENTE|nr:S26 family signal peptidase [Enterococcus sp. 665A]MBO1341927.1 S26 family signal peptidase [Enterococcus sp. 665A]
MNYYKKITVFYGAVIVFFFLLTTLTIVIPRLLEVTPYVVEDNKMAPKYSKGGLLFVRPNRRQAQAGDSITYYENQGQSVKTRRVLSVDEKINGYFVKGDNVSNAEMGLVHFRNFIGKPAFYLPYIGFLVNTQFMNMVKASLFLLAILLTLLTILYQKSYYSKKEILEKTCDE